MNFYATQDNAKKKTRYLVLIYVLVLLTLTVLSSIVLMLLVPVALGKPLPSPFWQSLFSPQQLPIFLGVGAFIIGGALISSFLKSRHLSKGGGVVAAALGGVKISPNSNLPSERKILNVVEEMSIASGMPVPEVYLLKNESGINAFAAGQTPVDAVIGITQGAIDKLTRSQLQGVIGHEFSHILNGDMRLNLRIIMLLHGIEFVGFLGRILTSSQRSSRSYSSRRSKSNGAVVLVGLLLRIIGWFGVLFGNLIQAAVSRQREFLADASSVQFTRDPSAISGALKVIGYQSNSSKIRNTDVHEVAHMFFGQSFTTRFTSLFATHPPIDMRIRTIEPGWDGLFIKPLRAPTVTETVSGENQKDTEFESRQPFELLIAAGVLLEAMDQQAKTKLNRLVEDASDPLEAMAIIYAILIMDSIKRSDNDKDKNSKEYQSLNSILQGVDIKGLPDLVFKHLAHLKTLQLNNILPMVELSMPALKEMSKGQYQKFKQGIESLMRLDGQKSVFEQSIYQLVTRYLDVHFGLKKVTKVRYKKASQVSMELQLVFSVLSDYGHGPDLADKLSAQLAFEKSMRHLGLGHLQKLELDDSHQATFEQVTQKLQYCSLALKQKIADAMALCVEHDGQVNSFEKELVLAIAATMDSPLPRLSSHKFNAL